MVYFEELFYGDTLPLAVLFLVFFAAIYFLMNRGPFRSNRQVSVVISAGVSLLAVWGIFTQTDELYFSFAELFNGIEGSLRMVIFIAVIVLILMLLYKGFGKGLRKLELPWVTFALAAIGIFIWFLPDFISVYYLPDVLLEDSVRFLFLIAGIGLAIYSLFKIKKLRLRRRIVGDEEYH